MAAHFADFGSNAGRGGLIPVHQHGPRTFGDEFPDDAFAKSRTAASDDGDLASKSHICSSIDATIGEVGYIAQSDYLNALLAFLV
ncbi:hypothetical protein NKH52_24905 [Mesorhizobium sp. M1066]|uniref:hypothetical protein n=1 Tax=unclassified Mesorhizobium TaxID=325217 RepID=UPI003334D64E